ncbi:MAG: SHOCT domain-containing protein [Nitrospiraceae bacterium]
MSGSYCAAVKVRRRREVPLIAALCMTGVLLLSVAAGYAQDDTRLRALEKAYADGILTKDEFEAKKRALEPTQKPAPAKATPPPKSSADSKAATYRMRYVQVMDAQGWEKPVEAFRILLPSDWTHDGGVRWVMSLGCPANTIQLQFRAVAPDGVTGIEFLPGYNWVSSEDPLMLQVQQRQAQNQQGCNPGPVVGAADFLRTMLVPQYRKGAQVLTAERLEGATRAIQGGLQPIN